LVQPLVLTFRRIGLDTAPLTVRYQIVDEDSNLRSRIGVSRGPVVEWQGEDSSRDIGAFRSEAYSLLRSSRVILGENDQANQQTVILRLTNLREDISSGIYREQFTVRYWCGDDEGQAPHELQGAVAVSVAIPNVLSANVAGASARGEIDFLDFAVRGRDLQVSVRSTGPYRVSARSINGGVMLREQARVQSDPADRIQYVASFDGSAVQLDGTAGPLMERAGLVGRQIPLSVQVEDTSTKRAGVYADTILLTLSPAN
jgi:spore coat protein U-like protein